MLYNPGRIVSSGIQNIYLTNLEYEDLRVPSCRALAVQERALRIAMAGPDCSDETAATAAAALACSGSNVSAATLLEFAQRFADRGQHAAAAHAFLGAARPLQALEVVEMHDVTLDEELAERLAPSERSSGDASGGALLLPLLYSTAWYCQRENILIFWRCVWWCAATSVLLCRRDCPIYLLDV